MQRKPRPLPNRGRGRRKNDEKMVLIKNGAMPNRGTAP